MKKKKILLMSDDLRMHSGIATQSKEFVIGTMHKYDWVQLGGAVKHPENGKIIEMSQAIKNDYGIDGSLKIYPVTGYGNPDKPGHLVEVDKNFKKYDVVGNVGTLYVQNGNLIHGSYPNKTKDKTRGMFSATYLPKGEKFLPGANSRRRVMNEV